MDTDTFSVKIRGIRVRFYYLLQICERFVSLLVFFVFLQFNPNCASMYAYVTGKVAEKTPTQVVIDNQGIGYLVNITLNTFTAIGEKEEVKLYVHEQILEDAHHLFGFYSAKERDLFELLISVSGVGCNTARLILSSLTVNELSNAIASDDVKTIQAVKGIGAKTAQRIVIDLKDKLKKNDFPTEIFAPQNNTIKNEALSALTILGFGKAAVDKALDKLLKQMPDANVETLIKEALKIL
jgi:Holliday junction DNA helicase RuvA